jgi:hypothetical protein
MLSWQTAFISIEDDDDDEDEKEEEEDEHEHDRGIVLAYHQIVRTAPRRDKGELEAPVRVEPHPTDRRAIA